MDKHLKKFVYISITIFALFFIIIIGFAYFYQYSTINTYNYLLLIIISVTIIIFVLFIFSGISIFITYKRKELGLVLAFMVKIGLKLLLPFFVFISGAFNSGIFKGNKDDIRNIYIEVNNIVVQNNKKKYLPKEILLLLPHCLQNSDCGYKVTNDINNCHKCGKCCIGDISQLATEKGILAVVVTGGTIARKIVSEYSPKLVLSVACERDLTSGISDISKLPVIGIINERPNGPCNNTFVDTVIIRNRIEELL